MTIGRNLVNLCRSLHLYITIGGLGLLLFVALSGFVLNHPELFPGEGSASTAEISISAELTSAASPDKLAIVEQFRARFTKLGAVDSKEFEIDDAEIRITFRKPGHVTTATIDRKTGQGTLSTDGHGTIGTLGDLHRVKNAGRWWKWAMDAAAVLLALSCLTGALLWLSMKNRRIRGLIALLIGTGILLGLYYFTVP